MTSASRFLALGDPRLGATSLVAAGFIEGGTVNDSSDLLAFVEDATALGLSIRIPPGTWVFDGPRMSFTVDNIHIFGHGPSSIIKMNPSFTTGSETYGWFRFYGCADPFLQDFTIDMSFASRGGESGTEWPVMGAGSVGLRCEGMTFRDSSAGVRLKDHDDTSGSIDTLVESCTMENVGLCFWMDDDAENSKGVRYCDNVHKVDTPGERYFAGCELNLCDETQATITGNDFGSPWRYAVALARCTDVVIANNLVDRVADPVFSVGPIHIEDGSERVTVSGNKLVNSVKGSGVEVISSSFISITGNSIDNGGVDAAVFLRAQDGRSTNNVTISGNVLSNASGGVSFQEDTGGDLIGVTVVGNTIADMTTTAVAISGDGTLAVITSNVFFDCADDVTGSATAIAASVVDNNLTVTS